MSTSPSCDDGFTGEMSRLSFYSFILCIMICGWMSDNVDNRFISDSFTGLKVIICIDEIGHFNVYFEDHKGVNISTNESASFWVLQDRIWLLSFVHFEVTAPKTMANCQLLDYVSCCLNYTHGI